ncbi:gliding motility-associated C-terminal domain-containing protein [bacterium]|nr:gliding motility-associated C-terminal domain-containing protein [bacterium]
MANPSPEITLDEALLDYPEDSAAYRAWKQNFALEEASRHPRTTAPMALSVNNGYVDCQMSNGTGAGAFEEGARPTGGGSWLRLTYYYPSVPWSFSIYKIDSHTPEQVYRTGPDCAAIPAPNSTYVSGGIIYTVWNNRYGVKIVQELSCVALGAVRGDNEQVKCTTKFIPVDGSCHNCGCLVYYDTRLNSNDGAPISTAYGYTGLAEIFFAPSIPSIWRAYEHGYPPGAGDLQALGILVGFEATMPDVFWCGRWPASYINGWDDSYWIADATGDFGSDTATMVKWYQRNVCPGDTLVFTTYYGIGDMGEFPIVQIVHTPPEFIATCVDVIPNPFTINAQISNIGNGNASNVNATLNLSGSGLSLVSGANPQNLGTLVSFTGMNTASWSVSIPPSRYGTTVCYDISVNYRNPDYSYSTETETYCVDIPELYDVTATATSELPSLCAGECTRLHALYSGGAPGGTEEWSTTFEPTNGGFSGTGSWEWGNPDQYFDVWDLAFEGPSDAYSNPNCWGTDLDYMYGTDNANWVLNSPEISLVSAVNPVLTFYHYMDCESYFDGGNVKISTDGGGSWTLINPVGGYPEDAASGSNAAIPGQACYSASTGGWVRAEFNLNAYIGRNIRIRFQFGTDFSVNDYPGWYIDNFRITGLGSAFESFRWWPSTGLSSTTAPDPNACPTTTTTYYVEVDLGYGCIDTAMVTIVVNPSPTVVVYDAYLCEGESITLTAYASPSTGVTYYWSPGGYNTPEITVSPSVSTDYIVTVSAGGCLGVDTAHVMVFPSPTVTLNTDTICAGEYARLEATVTPPGGTVSYWWEPGGYTTSSIDVMITETTQFVVSVMRDGCPGADTTTVYVEPTPLVTVESESICAGDGARLEATVSPADGDISYFWEPGGYNTPSIDVFPTENTAYTVMVTRNGCASRPDTATVFVSPPIFIDPGRENTIMIGECVELGGAPTATGGFPGLSYQWIPTAGLDEPSSPNPRACPLDTTIYCVVVTDTIGCWDSACVTIIVLFDTIGPIAEIIEPLPGTFSACEDQRIIIVITDDYGVDRTTLELQVDRDIYTNDSPEISWSGDTVFFTPPLDFWADGQVVSVSLIRADDIYGNPLQRAPIEWTYTMDFAPPVAWGEFPPADTIVTTSSPVITVFVADSGSGLDYSEMGLFVNGVYYPYDTTGMRFDPVSGELNFDPSALGVRFNDGDTVEVCLVGAQDMPDYCRPNVIIDYCWEFHVVIAELYALIIEPFNGAYSACDDQRIIIELVSPYTIDTTTIELFVEAEFYDISHEWLTFEYDSLLIFQPPAAYWIDAQVVEVVLARADDIYGFPLDDSLSWSFIIDLSPPVLTNPSPFTDDVVADSTPLLSFDLADSLSGLDESTLELTIGGYTVSIGDPGVSWDGSHFELDCETAGITFRDNDTVTVCLYAEDSPDYCDPNILDTCWTFVVVLAGPIATILEPLNDTYTACNDQCIYITIVDEDGVDIRTIELEVNSVVYTISTPELSYSGDTLIFCPLFLWEDGETVNVHLLQADDIWGNGLQNHPLWFFIADLSEPLFGGEWPLNNSVVADPYQEIMVSAWDSLSGLSDSSILITVNGLPYSLLTPGMFFSWDSTGAIPVLSIEVEPESLGLEFAHNETVSVCIYAHDSPDYCAPNDGQQCWEFSVDLLGPVADLEFPFNGAISSCADQGAIITIRDREEDHGVDTASLVYQVTVADTILAYPDFRWEHPETLFFEPFAPIWNNNDSVTVSLLDARDSLGNGLDSLYRWWFWVDLEHPWLINTYPAPGAEIGDLSPTISFVMLDNLAGVALDSTRISVNGVWYELSDPAFYRTDSLYRFSCTAAGILFAGGDAVEICVRGIDWPDLCEPNTLDTCWNFAIPVGGPIGIIIEPLNNTYSACHDQNILMLVQDPDGVLDSTIVLEVNTISYTTSDPELRYDDDTLRFVPSDSWTNGDVVSVTLLAADDIYFNPLEAVVSWSFIIDLTPPVVTGISPVPGSVIYTTCPILEFDLTDALSGLDESSVSVEINARSFRLTDPYVDWDGSGFSLDLCAAGFDFSGGDVLNICLYAGDSPDYCPPNVLDTCWTVRIAGGGPIAAIISPLNETFTACNPETIYVSLFDSNGVDDTTINLMVNGTDYSIGDDELNYEDDLLIFTGGTHFWADGDVVSVQLTRADDILGNPLETPLSWTFTVDYSPPYHFDEHPGIGTVVEDFSPLIWFSLTDDLSGLDSATVTVSINGIWYDLEEDALWWGSEEIYFDPDLVPVEFPPGSVVEVCVSAYDLPDYCDPNHSLDCWEFDIARGGPVAAIINPFPNTYSACEDQGIIVSIVDSNGVVPSTIQLEVNSVVYTVDDDELTFEDDLLTFIPEPYFEDGMTIHVHLLAAEDSIGNTLETDLEWEFIMDLSPPAAWELTPAGGSVVSEPSPSISFRIVDILSGLAESSVTLTVAGTPFDVLSSCVYWDGELFELNTGCAGLSWPGGTRIEACLTAWDLPDYCDPNTLEVCWYFNIATGGPVAEIVIPFDGAISACEDQEIHIYLFDIDGVDPATIELHIGDSIYSIDDDRLSYLGDTLFFIPGSGYWMDNQVVPVALTAADDLLGNGLEAAPVEGVFYLDLSGPVTSNFLPDDGADIYDWQQLIQVDLADNLLGVDPASINLQLEGVYRATVPLLLNLSNAGLAWDGSTITLDPSSVDDAAWGIVYLPQEDSLTGTGIYFPEFDSIRVTVYARDNEPDYCEPNYIEGINYWAFYIPDDDLMGPRYAEFAPLYRPTRIPFEISCNLIDSSGIWGDSVYTIYQDNRGSRTDTINLEAAPGADTAVVNGEYVISFLSSENLPAFPDTCTVKFVVYAYDNDHDFLNPLDRTQTLDSFYVMILQGPTANVIEPLPMTITSCADQRILITLYDEDGVDPSTINLHVEADSYNIDHNWLEYFEAESLLVFTPDFALFSNEQLVDVSIVNVEDNLGNPMWDTLAWSFYVDLEAPVCSLEYPYVGMMLQDPNPIIEIRVDDNLAGVWPDTISLNINGLDYTVADDGIYWYFDDDNINGNLVVNSEAASVYFAPGDTVNIRLRVGDKPDYCAPNMSRWDWWFTIEPRVSCYAAPNPFTPNNDNYNDYILFHYPRMFSTDANVSIYDLRNVKVWEKTVPSVNEITDYLERTWDGRDTKGKILPEGIYIYVLQVEGKVECTGSIILAR